MHKHSSHRDLIALIEQGQKKVKLFSRLGKISLVIIAAFFVVTAVFKDNLGDWGNLLLRLFVAAIIAAFFSFFASESQKKQIKKLIKSSFSEEISTMLANAFELFEYRPDSHLDFGHFRRMPIDFNRLDGSDLVTGKYQGIPFTFCDIEITKEDSSEASKTIYVFKGQWLELSLNKSINATVYVREGTQYKTFNIGSRLQKVETDSFDFNKNFTVYTDDPQTAFYILTPHFMEIILAADKAAASASEFYFSGNRVIIALRNARDLFDMENVEKADDLVRLRAKFQADVRFITNIFDVILKNEYLFERGRT